MWDRLIVEKVICDQNYMKLLDEKEQKFYWAAQQSKPFILAEIFGSVAMMAAFATHPRKVYKLFGAVVFVESLASIWLLANSTQAL